MSKYATLAEVKQHLRYDDESNDLILAGFLAGAETVIDNYITDPVTDKMMNVLKVATLLLVGNMDDDRNAGKDKSDNDNYLPPPVRRLLYPYRTPTAIFAGNATSTTQNPADDDNDTDNEDVDFVSIYKKARGN